MAFWELVPEQVVFRVFDHQQRGKISFEEFKQVLAAHFSTEHPLVKGEDMAQIVRLYFGGQGGACDVSEKDFSMLLHSVQEERLKRAFLAHDATSTGSISAKVRQNSNN